MKKLLITTALAGAMIGGSAIAQTTITGELRVGYKAISNDSAGGAGSGRGFGAEQQINIQTKGKTNIGWDYAAGFSLENDGETSTQTGTLYNENAYFDFINGNSMITIGRDHIQRSDSARSNGVLFGYDPRDILDGMGTLAQDSSMLFQQNIGAAPGQNYGLGVVQTLPGFGKVSVNYVPENTQPGASEATFSTEAESAYEIGFTGDLGVKGLDLYAFKHEEKKREGQTHKREGENYGIKYTMGQASAGYTRKEHTGSGALSTTTEVKENHYGVAYAVSPNLTVGANMFKADGGLTTADAKVTALQLGYNLGPVALTAGVAKAENVRGSSAAAEQADKIGFLRLLGAF